MKTGTVTIRMPEDKIERLKGIAKKQGISVSELLREPISTWLDLGAIGGGGNEEVLKRLQELEGNIIGSQVPLADVLVTTLRTSIGARYMANKAAENTDELVSYMSSDKPLDATTKAQWQTLRDEECEQIAQQWIAMALGMSQPKPEDLAKPKKKKLKRYKTDA